MKSITLLLIGLFLVVPSLLAAEEKSYLQTRDDISMKVHKYFESTSDESSSFAESFYGEGLEVYINDLHIKGKDEYLKRLDVIRDQLFKDIKFEDLHVHTNYFSSEALSTKDETFGEYRTNEQTIWTNAWGVFTGVGRTTGNKVSFRMHMDFRTSKGKVVEMLAFYDPAQMQAEMKALEATKN